MKPAATTLLILSMAIPKISIADNLNRTHSSAIVLYGHSFLSNKQFAMSLSRETNLNVFDYARGGSSSQEAAFISGGEAGLFSPQGGVIPATGSVVMVPHGVMSEEGALWPGFYSPVIFSGVRGVLSSKKISGEVKYIFKRDNPGQEIQVTNAIRAFPVNMTRVNSGTEKAGAVMSKQVRKIFIIWAGRNTARGNISYIIRDIKSIASTAGANDKYIVMPEFPYSNEVTGSQARTNINKLNEEIKNSFPENYCVVNGLDALQNFSSNYNKNNIEDLKDISKGVTPSTLRMDSLHPSDSVNNGASISGVDINAKFIADCLRDKGWIK
ncbi:TPA: hypothetical protein I8Y21_003572 [Klebsiella oxytoca]|uniref:Uncharacterized protein n=1 Tax=Klebsiella oxytoca TaxID=571 RepID=A0AAN5REQ0_KLEOX|nr:hypothetical protein [Klebsiella oxytoca]